ncbi:MAG: hypothetical protein J6K17_07470 [Oscillospiraceae bacterium]|nr:hypothetical protein [Oscillospiraceae bacterium]
MNKKIFALLTAVALCLTGCSAKVTEKDADEDVLELVDDCGFDIEDFSEPALEVLYTMDVNDLVGFYDIYDEDDFEYVISEYISNRSFCYFDNEKDAKKAVNAEFEDMLLMYKVEQACLNAQAIGYLTETYSAICENNGESVDDFECTGKIKAKAPSGEVKFNGKDKDLILFIQKCINEDARNGYFYFEYEYDGEYEFYWSADKSMIDDDDNFDDEYEWDLGDIAEGEPVIGACCYDDVDIIYSGTNLYKAVKNEDFVNDADEEEFQNYYWSTYFSVSYMIESLQEEIDENIEDVVGDKNVNPVKTDEANANAKQAFIAIASAITQAGINGEVIDAEIIEISEDNLYAYGIDLSMYLGDSFEGYAMSRVDPSNYAVYMTIWSDKPIPEKYRETLLNDYQSMDDDWQSEALKDGQMIGMYPIMPSN